MTNFTEDNPPAIFTTVLQGPVVESSNITDTAYINRGQLLGQQLLAGSKNLDLFSFAGYAKSDPNQSEPRDKYHVRNYIYGRDRFGRQLNPCETLYGIFYGENCDAANPIFWFSGDPVTQTGWLDNLASDDRKFTSIGPFNLEKDKPVEIITALTVGRGTDHLNSITVGRDIVRSVIEEYKNNFSSMTYNPPEPTNPVDNYILYHNYPNPFNPTTTIRYELPQDGVVTIKIYDILGQEVRTILNEFKQADRYEFNFNAIGLASGIYIYRMKVNDFIASKKMVLVR